MIETERTFVVRMTNPATEKFPYYRKGLTKSAATFASSPNNARHFDSEFQATAHMGNIGYRRHEYIVE